MTDVELVAALGWLPCERSEDGYYCERHDARWATNDVCYGMEDALDHAEQGIDLLAGRVLLLVTVWRRLNRDHWLTGLDMWDYADQLEQIVDEVGGGRDAK